MKENSMVMTWIPCSEGPPDTNRDVFVYLFGDRPYIAWYEEDSWWTEEFEVSKDDEPEAWMELPEKFRG